MAKHIITLNDSLGRPVTSETFNHIYESYQEQISSHIIGLIESIYGIGSYDTTKIYILQGCVDTISGGNHNISSGAVFFNGEVYQSDSQVFARIGTSDFVVADMSTTYYSGINPDPIVFQDLSSHNVHQILKIIFSANAVSGTGSFNGGLSTKNNLSNFINIFPKFISTGLIFGTGCANFGTPYYNVGYKIKGNEISLCGVIEATTIGSTATVLTLPLIIRPTSQCDLFVNVTGALTGFNVLKIKTDGTCVFINGGGVSGEIYLDNVSYRLN